MDSAHVDGAAPSFWFVGAFWGEDGDQTSRFLEEEIWENGDDGGFLDKVRSMRPGDRIAIKAAYRRKHGLPFDSRGELVSVMAIKATGTITENLGDGKRVRVDWSATEDPAREWYLHVYQPRAQRLMLGNHWMTDGLIEFAFENKPQDIVRFLNDPRWRERYGTGPQDQRFLWTRLYQAIADRLLNYRNDRSPLVQRIHDIAARVESLSAPQDRFADGSTGPLADICPFTTLAMFNRGMKDANRQIVAKELADFLGVEVPVPNAFPGIPVVNNQRTWFFGYSKDRDDGDIDALWDVFAAALQFADADMHEYQAELTKAYDRALNVRGVAWTLSMALYWVRPWDFAPLDALSRDYISDVLGMRVPTTSRTRPGDGESYLRFLDELKARFDDESCPVHSFPELSLAAWNQEQETPDDKPVDSMIDDPAVVADEHETYSIETYSATDVVNEGCFLERQEIERLLERLRTRKNLILQGPPGTGKTWLAKRLAFALIGERDERKVRAVQFHPNLSYEDFVRGWRPVGDGKLALADGVFMETLRAASADPSAKFVVVIEEINRGNPAQIFGELLTLLEADKRSPRDAVELCYPDADGTRRPVHVPENVYVIGTMNIADRSLALVDLALRRRFAFVTLEPSLGAAWSNWVVQECGIDPGLVDELRHRIGTLNDRIAVDNRLGSQFQVGHSYVTPTYRLESGATRDWFRQVVETEIGPLLEEYWFDSPADAREAAKQLLEGW